MAERLRGSGVLDALFTSRVRVRLLVLFLMNPGARFYARALTRAIGAQYNAVWKELARLERAGVLQSETVGRVKHYTLDPRLPILEELRRIVVKTVGLGDAIRQALAGHSAIYAAFVYGSFASGELDAASDVDLMIVGTVALTTLAPVISQLEKELSRAINYALFTRAEWEARLQAKDPFITNVAGSDKIMLIGDEDALRGTGASSTNQALSRASGRDRQAAASRQSRLGRRRAQSRPRP